MALAKWHITITDLQGNVVPNATVYVVNEANGGVPSLYADRDGLAPIGNPMSADEQGFASFHVIGGAYRISASSAGFSREWRYVGIGTAQEYDVDAFAAGAGWDYVVDTPEDLPPDAIEGERVLVIDAEDGRSAVYERGAGTSWIGPIFVTGPEGLPGPANEISIGDVVEGPADASITGEYPNQQLNLSIPKGDTGDITPELEQLLLDTQEARDEAVSAAPSTWQDILIATESARDDSLIYAENSSDSADRSESAADLAFVNADVYADIAEGLAATSVGQQFQVEIDGEAIRYRHDAGPVAAELIRFPTTKIVSKEGLLLTTFDVEDLPLPSLRNFLISEQGPLWSDGEEWRFVDQNRPLPDYAQVTSVADQFNALASYDITNPNTNTIVAREGFEFVDSLSDRMGNYSSSVPDLESSQPEYVDGWLSHKTMRFSPTSRMIWSEVPFRQIARNVATLTIVSVIKINSHFNNATIIGMGSASLDSYRAGIRLSSSSGNIDFIGRRLDSDTQQLITAPITFDRPVVVVAVFDWINSKLTGYINGQQVASSESFQTPGLTSASNSTWARIGSTGANTNHLSADVYLAQFYRAALTPEQVTDLSTRLAQAYDINSNAPIGTDHVLVVTA